MRTRFSPLGTFLGSAAFITVMVVVGVVGLNFTAAAATLSPLLGVAALLVTLIVLLGVGERLGERWIPAVLLAFRSCCRGAVRRLRDDR